MHASVNTAPDDIFEVVTLRDALLVMFPQRSRLIHDATQQCLQQKEVCCSLKQCMFFDTDTSSEEDANWPDENLRTVAEEAREILRASRASMQELSAEKEAASKLKREEAARIEAAIQDLNLQARAKKVRSVQPRLTDPPAPHPRGAAPEHRATRYACVDDVDDESSKKRRPTKQKCSRTLSKHQAIARQEQYRSDRLLRQVNRKIDSIPLPDEQGTTTQPPATCKQPRDRVTHSEVITTQHTDAMKIEMTEFWVKEGRDLEELEIFWPVLLDAMRDPTPCSIRPSPFARRLLRHPWHHALLRQLDLGTIMTALSFSL